MELWAGHNNPKLSFHWCRLGVPQMRSQSLYGFGGAAGKSESFSSSVTELICPVAVLWRRLSLCYRVCSALIDLEALTKKAVHAELSTTYRHPPLT